MTTACLYGDEMGRRARQARETGPDLLCDQEIELIQRWRGTFMAEGTMPPGSPMLPGDRIPRTRKKPPTAVTTTSTPAKLNPHRPPAWLVAVLVGSIAWLATLWLVTR